jgi:hypothetical protein
MSKPAGTLYPSRGHAYDTVLQPLQKPPLLCKKRKCTACSQVSCRSGHCIMNAAWAPDSAQYRSASPLACTLALGLLKLG